MHLLNPYAMYIRASFCLSFLAIPYLVLASMLLLFKWSFAETLSSFH